MPSNDKTTTKSMVFRSFVSDLNNLLSDFSSVNWILWDLQQMWELLPGPSSRPFLYTFYQLFRVLWPKPCSATVFPSCSSFAGPSLGISVLVYQPFLDVCSAFLATILPFAGMHRSCFCRIRALPSKPKTAW